ncbi:MAG: alpha/beta hydrolase [Oscillospiraceae bacterium]|nr:alpha/beta hydrolase [Oscillospiraceae bacterium]
MTPILIIASILVAVVLLTSYICFHITFYVTKAQKACTEEYPIPAGKAYEPWRDKMIDWIKETRALPCREFFTRSFDGLMLHGKFYEYAPGAPIEIMIHGYRGNAERDLCGGVQRCFALGHSALVIDQRGSGKSQGNVITFGIREHQDCLKWIELLVEVFGPDVKIILTGISMGASTVLMAAGQQLPKNVIGVLADCGYTTAKEIIKIVIRKLKLPANLAYPFVKLGAFLYGGFRLEKDSAISAMSRCKIPVIFYHGESDDFVPCYMSQENYNACTSKKQLVTIPNAGHGLCYLVDPEQYLSTLKRFFPEETLTAPNSNA